MALKARIAALSAACTLAVGGLGVAGALPAAAGTPECGVACTDVWSLKFGGAFVLDVYQREAAAGQPVILFQQSPSDPAEDFVIQDLGQVSDLGHGRVPGAVRENLAPELAYQIEYEPDGEASNLCAGTEPDMTVSPYDPVALYPCSESASTVWVHDTNPALGATAIGYGVLISAETDSFTDPLVLTYPAGNPTDMPRVQLDVQPLSTYSKSLPRDGTVSDSQQWSAFKPPV